MFCTHTHTWLQQKTIFVYRFTVSFYTPWSWLVKMPSIRQHFVLWWTTVGQGMRLWIACSQFPDQCFSRCLHFSFLVAKEGKPPLLKKVPVISYFSKAFQTGHSSVGRASDCRYMQQSDGPWFDSGWPDCIQHLRIFIFTTGLEINSAFGSMTSGTSKHELEVQKLELKKIETKNETVFNTWVHNHVVFKIESLR